MRKHAESPRADARGDQNGKSAPAPIELTRATALEGGNSVHRLAPIPALCTRGPATPGDAAEATRAVRTKKPEAAHQKTEKFPGSEFDRRNWVVPEFQSWLEAK